MEHESTEPLFEVPASAPQGNGLLYRAVKKGDRREALIQLRDSLAIAIDTTDSGRDIAALSRRLMDVMEEIDSLPDPDQSAANPVERARRRIAEDDDDG